MLDYNVGEVVTKIVDAIVQEKSTSGYMYVDNLKDAYGVEAVVSVYLGERPCHLVLAELYDIVEADEKYKDIVALIQKLKAPVGQPLQ